MRRVVAFYLLMLVMTLCVKIYADWNGDVYFLNLDPTAGDIVSVTGVNYIDGVLKVGPGNTGHVRTKTFYVNYGENYKLLYVSFSLPSGAYLDISILNDQYQMITNITNIIGEYYILDLKDITNKAIQIVLKLNNQTSYSASINSIILQKMQVYEVPPGQAILLPNPFYPENQSAKIIFSVPDNSQVYISIFNAEGNKVRDLVRDFFFVGGRQVIEWEGRNDKGKILPSGVYILMIKYRNLTTGEVKSSTYKFVIINTKS